MQAKDLDRRPPKKSWPWVLLCLVVACVSVFYRFLVLGEREQTALLFVGLPLMLAIGLSLTPRPRSVTGVIMKGISLALLLFGVLLIEGFICILMAAPLFFLVGWIVGWIADRARRVDKASSWHDDRMRCSVLGVMMLMSFEGVTDWLSFDRNEEVVVVEVVDGSASYVRGRLAHGPDFDLEELPLFLQLGFPLPVSIEGGSLEVGDVWRVHFEGGEGEPGDLVVKVVSSSPSCVRLECEQDGSHISHWMAWKSVEWTIEEIEGGKCRVSMVMEYERLLDPAWYFKPIERHGVKKSGEYFLGQIFKD